MPKLDLQPITELDLQPYEEGGTVLDLQEIEEQAKDTLRLADETEKPIGAIEDFYESIKGEERVLKPLFKKEWETQGKIGVGEQIGRMDAIDWMSRVPFSPYGLFQNMATLRAVNRLKKDKYEKAAPEITQVGAVFGFPALLGKTPSQLKEQDIKLIENYFLKIGEEQVRGTTFGAKVFAGATYLPAWMMEFLVTGGLAKMGNVTAKEIAAKSLQGYARTKAGQIILKGAGWTGSAITRTTLGMPHRIAAEAIGRRIPEQVNFGPNNELVFDVVPETWATSIFKGWLQTVVEVASEQSGRGLTVGAKALATKLPFGGKIVAALSKLRPGESVQNFFTRAGWSNLLGEIGEERLATILHGILDTEDFGTGPDSNMLDRLKAGISQDIQQFPVELAVLSLPAGVKYVAGRVVKPPEALPEAVTPVEPAPIPPKPAEAVTEGKPEIEPQTEAESNQLTLESDAAEATDASRQYLNQPAKEDLPEGEPIEEDTGFVKNVLHNLGIKDKGDYEPLTNKDYREIYKFFQMPYDVGLSYPQFKPIYETQRARELTKLNLDTSFADKLQPYFQMDKNNRAKIDAALCEADRNPAETFGPKRLKEIGLDENQIKAFLAVRTSFDESLNMLTDRMEKAGMKKEAIDEFKARAGNYISHKWYGNWAVVVKEVGVKKPKTIFMTKTNYTDRFKERKRLQKLYPDAKVIILKANKIPYQAFQESAPWAVHRMVDMTIERAEANPETVGAMREALSDIYKSKGFGMHFIKRKNIPGYTEDLQRPIAEYFNGFTGYITKMQAIQEFSENITAVNPQRTPNLYRYALDYIKYVTGDVPEFAKAKRIAYSYYLWGNIKSASLNITQNLTLGWPVLSKHTDFALPKILQAQARTIHPAMLIKGEKGFLKELEDAGYLQPQLTQEISAYAKNPLMQGIRTKTGKVLSFLDIFRHMESFNRRSMAVALWDSGITDIDEVGKIIEESHFRYGKGNRPALARGYISPIMTFRSWGINYFTWLKNEIKAGRVAPEAKSVAAIVFLGGLKALPFATLFVWIWRKVFGTDPEAELRKAIGKTAGQIAMRGAPSQIGISFTGSISPMDIPSPADIGTFQKTITEIGGVFADVPSRVGKVTKSLLVKDYSRALEDAAPEVLRNPLAAYRLHEQGAKTRSGRVILDLESGEPLQMTTGEMARKILAYQPIRIAEQYDIQKALDQLYGDRMKLKQNWADRYWLSFLNDDKEEMLNITGEIIDYNSKMTKRGRDDDVISISEMDNMLTTRARPVNIPAKYMMPKYQDILNKFYNRKFGKE